MKYIIKERNNKAKIQAIVKQLPVLTLNLNIIKKSKINDKQHISKLLLNLILY